MTRYENNNKEIKGILMVFGTIAIIGAVLALLLPGMVIPRHEFLINWFAWSFLVFVVGAIIGLCAIGSW